MSQQLPENVHISLEENLKKALTELLILKLLSKRDYYIGELTATLSDKSDGALNIVFPYAAIYRLLEDELIVESRKRIAPDRRRRQYYTITDTGRIYLARLLEIYTSFSQGVAAVLTDEEE